MKNKLKYHLKQQSSLYSVSERRFLACLLYSAAGSSLPHSNSSHQALMDSTFPDIFSPQLQCPGGIFILAYRLFLYSSMGRDLDGNAKSVSSVAYCSQVGLQEICHQLLCYFQETLLLLTGKLSMSSFIFHTTDDKEYNL